MEVIDDDTLCTDQFYLWSKIELLSMRQKKDTINLGAKWGNLTRISGMRRAKCERIVGEFCSKRWAEVGEENTLTIFVGRETGTQPQVSPIPTPNPIPKPTPVCTDTTVSEVRDSSDKERPKKPDGASQWFDEFLKFYVEELVPLGVSPPPTITPKFRHKARGAYFHGMKLDTKPFFRENWLKIKAGIETWGASYRSAIDLSRMLGKDSSGVWFAETLVLRGKASATKKPKGGLQWDPEFLKRKEEWERRQKEEDDSE